MVIGKRWFIFDLDFSSLKAGLFFRDLWFQVLETIELRFLVFVYATWFAEFSIQMEQSCILKATEVLVSWV